MKRFRLPLLARPGYKSAVTVWISGGLGNQLFQYAAGRRLAVKLGVPLVLDLVNYSTDPLRKYALHAFNIQCEISDSDGVAIFNSDGFRERLYRKIQRNLPFRMRSYVVERHFHFDPEVLRLPPGVYLWGYWQSEKYFADVSKQIREELTLKEEPNAQNREIAEHMGSVDSISVHVRRGDYVTNPETRRWHGHCDLEYYRRTMTAIAERVQHPNFFIFSDDFEWVRDNLRPAHPCTYVSHNGAESDYLDMWLMSRCRHHIISNSTFGWWSAWLNPRKDKIVFAPARWFSEAGHDTSDLIPEGWVRK